MKDESLGKTLARTVDRSASKSFFRKVETDPLFGVDPSKINYKNPDLLKQFISEGGRLLPRRITNVSAKNQRKIKRVVKNLRFIGILPYTSDTNNNNK
jgi:small subunit ribosomal protein S18